VRHKRDGSKDAQGQPALEGLVFLKREGDWIIADQASPFLGVPVMSSQIVSDILDRIGRIKVTDSNVISSNADEVELAEKEVEDKTGMRIQCSDANQQILADLYVGRSAGKGEGGEEDVKGTFLRKADTKQIVLFEDAFPLDLDAKSWIDKTRRDVSPDEVKEIEVEGKADGKKIKVHFKRDGNKGWKAVETPAGVGPLKAFSVTEIINAACRVDAADILATLNPAQLQQYGLAPKSRLHIILKTKDDKSLDLFIGKRVEGKQDYYAHIGGKLLFSVAEWYVSRFEKEAKDYYDPKPVEIKKSGTGSGKSPSKGAGKGDTSPEEAEAQPTDPAKKAPAKNEPAKKEPAKKEAGQGAPTEETPTPVSEPKKLPV